AGLSWTCSARPACPRTCLPSRSQPGTKRRTSGTAGTSRKSTWPPHCKRRSSTTASRSRRCRSGRRCDLRRQRPRCDALPDHVPAAGLLTALPARTAEGARVLADRLAAARAGADLDPLRPELLLVERGDL